MAAELIPRPADAPVAPTRTAVRILPPTLFERFCLHPAPSFALTAFVAFSLIRAEVSLVLTVLASFVVMLLPIAVVVTRPRLLMAAGEYGRATGLVRAIRAAYWLSRDRPEWRLLEAMCLLGVGAPLEAKSVLAGLEPGQLGARGDALRMCELALIYLRVGEARTALDVADDVSLDALDAESRETMELVRGTCAMLIGELERAHAEAEMMGIKGVSPAAKPGWLSLRATLALHRDGDLQRARALSAEARASLPVAEYGYASIRLAGLALEPDPAADPGLEAELATLSARAHELGANGLATLELLRACAARKAGRLAEARELAAAAARLPAAAHLQKRIAELLVELRGE